MSRVLATLLALALAVGVLGGARPAAAGLVLGTGAMSGQGCGSHCLSNVRAEPAPFVDASSYARPVTATAGATQSAVQVKFGAKSIALAANTDNVSVPDAPAWSFTGDFHLAYWAYATALGRTTNQRTGVGNQSILCLSSASCEGYDTGDVLVISIAHGASYTINAWHYVEFYRVGSTAYLLIDGITVGTDATAGGTLDDSTSAHRLGGTAGGMVGYVDGWVITSGGWAWSRGHTPPNRRW